MAKQTEKTGKKTPKKSLPARLSREVRLMYRELVSWASLKIARRKVPGSPKSFKKKKRDRSKKPEKTTRLIADSLRFIQKNWKILTIILMVYIGVYFVLAYARPNIDLPSVFRQASEAGTKPGVGDKLKTLSSAMFTYRGDATDFARWSQFFLAIIFSLIFIFAIRNIHKGIDLRARDALYSGTGNLIPFMMNMVLIALQLIPFTILSVFYNVGMAKELFIGNLEKFAATIILILSGLLTFWFIPTSIISLYAITIPGVYPTKTMQAVRIMVSRRRLEVVRHLTVFILFIFVSYLLLLLLLVTYLPRFANLSLDLFFLIALPMIHVMMYKLYLKLLDGAQAELNG